LPAARLAHLLAKEVDFAGIDNPRTTLQDALEALAEKYDVPFDLMEGAFSSEGVRDILKYEIAATPIPSMSRAPLGSVLNAILSRLPVGSGAVYYIERDQVLITTRAHATLHAWTEFKREGKSLLEILRRGPPEDLEDLRDIGSLLALLTHWNSVLVKNWSGYSQARLNTDGLSWLKRSCGFRP
jgi:hypothetical protein